MATPTLTMIPSGYKAQKVYSVLPLNGYGDFTFDRTTTATRVNKNGLIEQVATDVPRLDYPINFNLLSYSEDFGQWWIKTNSTVTTNQTTSPSGDLTADKLQRTSTTYNYLSKGIYKATQQLNMTISIFVKQGEGDFFAIRGQGSYPNRIDAIYQFSTNELNTSVGGDNFTVINSSVEEHINGWVRLSISFNTDNHGSVGTFFSPRSTSGFIDHNNSSSSSFVYIWGAQVEEQSYVTPYIPTPHGGCPSLLLEPYSLNLTTYSEDFSRGWSRYNSTVISSLYTTSPRGDLTADILQSTDTYQPMVQRHFNPPTTNTTYTFSVFVKKINTPYVALGVYNGSSDKNAIFDLDTKLSRSSVENASIKEFSNGWFRISITQTVLSTDSFSTWKILNSNGSSALTGVVGDKTFIWGAQLEALPFATSYIPTLTNSSVGSRGRETIYHDLGLVSKDKNTNTVVLKFIPMGFKQDFYELLRFSDGTNQIALEGFQTNNYDVYGNGLSPSGMIDGALSLDAGSINIISFSYSGTSLRFSHNGSTINTTTPTGNLPTITQVLNGASGLSPIKILELRVYNDFKTQEELNILTTITL